MHSVESCLCPVCGYMLGFHPWEGGSASDEICPCCYIQFGYDDWAEGDGEKRGEIYESWRKRWIEQGMKWSSKGQRPPDAWNPIEQLRSIGIQV